MNPLPTSRALPAASPPAGFEMPAHVLDELATTLDAYVITAAVAAFQYHHWLLPPPGLLTLRVDASDLERWRHRLTGNGVHAFVSPPSHKDVEALVLAVTLDRTLTPVLHSRRRSIAGLAYEAPEDLLLYLLARAKGETSIAETAAIIVAQHEQLDWAYLEEQAIALGLTRPLGIVCEIIHRETASHYIPIEFIADLRNHTPSSEESPPIETCYYPFNWRVKYTLFHDRAERIESTYPDISARWHVTIALPRYVVAKVVSDLRAA